MPDAPPVRTRRRSPHTDPLRKVSYQMHRSTIEGIRSAVAAGAAASQNAFVEQAVVAALRDRRRTKVYAAYRDAANDPAFMAEMLETTEAFIPTLGDGLGGSDV